MIGAGLNVTASKGVLSEKFKYLIENGRLNPHTLLSLIQWFRRLFKLPVGSYKKGFDRINSWIYEMTE